jgi:hypothetical protein
MFSLKILEEVEIPNKAVVCESPFTISAFANFVVAAIPTPLR